VGLAPVVDRPKLSEEFAVSEQLSYLQSQVLQKSEILILDGNCIFF
jgi:hypothetical protein